MIPSRLFLLLPLLSLAWAEALPAKDFSDDPVPKVLFNPTDPATGEVSANGESNEGVVTWAATEAGLEITVAPGGVSKFPGVKIVPSTPWNAAGYGHIEAEVTNHGTMPIRLNLRVDNDGPWQENRNNTGILSIKPGETKPVTTIFGFNYGNPAYQLDPGALTLAIVFIGSAEVEQKFTIKNISAGGAEGEKPPVDLKNLAVKPKGGLLLGQDAVVNGKQLTPTAGAAITLSDDAKSFTATFKDEKGTVLFHPENGVWSLAEALQARVLIKNTGSKAASPRLRLESKSGPSDIVASAKPIAPGAQGEIVVPFAAKVAYQMVTDPDQDKLELKKSWGEPVPGTGHKYASNVTKGITLLPDAAGGEQSYEVKGIIADMPAPTPLPAWLGKKPPVEGDWKVTFNDEFDGDSIDLSKWNIYSSGDYHIGAFNHFSKENVIVRDGKLTLRIEKKPGHHNDDPNMPENDWATGYADTFGKWTQRYGYWEIRCIIPTPPNSFYAYWLMPDRGIAGGEDFVRQETKKGGMEFDILEGLSIWGAYRHDLGMHWDSYMKYHKTIGMLNAYFQPDKDGYVTVGMLWLPGKLVFYDNGRESASWESPRIGSLQSFMILDNVLGGWEKEPIDEKKMPSDFVIDYVRVWQRSDLVTPGDGPVKNDGGPYAPGAGPKVAK